jgi:hypothetical protein
MTWTATTVPALRGDEQLTASLRYAAGDVCVVEVEIDGSLAARGEGPDLFEALAAARRILEAHDVLLACNGSRRNVFPSPMLRQAASGRRAYVLALPRSDAKPPTVDIFDPAPDLSTVVTVDEERAWFDQWRPSAGPAAAASI